MGSSHRSRFVCATLVLAFSTGMAVTESLAAPASRPGDITGARGKEVIDVALTLSLSRKVVPVGGSLSEVMRVTNRGTVTMPTGPYRQQSFGQEINKPGQPHYPGKAVYAFARSRGGHCSHGTYGPASKIQTFACDLKRLAPGESQKVRIKIKKIKGPLLLDAKGFYGASGRVYDYRRGNDAVRRIIRVRRR